VSVLAFSFLCSCNNQTKKDDSEGFFYQVPRVLIITTGKGGTGQLPEGVILIMEKFISLGAYVRVNTRDALLDEKYLSDFNILFLLSAIEYHDADRQYSLTFMEDIEIKILSEWVHRGGVLISGDNIGRNLRDGTDRISMFSRLDPENWGLSECFGVMLSERNVEGLRLEGKITDELNGELIPEFENETWILVPDSLLNNQLKVLAVWKNDSAEYPAMIMNYYGKGMCFLLPTSYLLHPSNNGGYWSKFQIQTFCSYVVDQFYSRFPIRVELQVWPSGYNAAFAVSLNSDGSIENYRKMNDFLQQKKIIPTLFVNSQIDEEIIEFIHSKGLNIQSNGYSKIFMRDLSFSETVFQIEMNGRFWKKKFSGFRFPFTKNSFWGMNHLNRKMYLFDSSIGIDHTSNYIGCLFPYHLPVYQGENYQVLDLLEIGPISKDDYYYYDLLLSSEKADQSELFERAQLYHSYLQYFWKNYALQNGGMMIYLGHPLFTAYNDTTLFPLSNLIDTVQKDGAWITTIEDIAVRWKQLDQLKLNVHGRQNHFTIDVMLHDDQKIENLTLKVDKKPVKIKSVSGKSEIIMKENHWLIIFEAFNGQKIEVWF
jgi:hypothetical protein